MEDGQLRRNRRCDLFDFSWKLFAIAMGTGFAQSRLQTVCLVSAEKSGDRARDVDDEWFKGWTE